MSPKREYTVGHFFCGAGGGVAGYAAARVEAAGVRARFRTVLAVDCWPTALMTCQRMTGAPVQLCDLFDREGYEAFHGRPPPPEWSPLTPAGLRAMCPTAPDVVFGSPPCKGFSRLLGASAASAPKYQALNTLVIRWLWLVLEAWPHNPPRLILMENVPDIADPARRRQRRGEALVGRVEAMLASYGYASRRTVHDCGPLGGLAQHRQRFLLVGRHLRRCPTLLYEPFTVPMRTIGDVIGDLPVPVGVQDVPGHDLPRLSEKTWQRLAFVEPGKDWRSIESAWTSAPNWQIAEANGLRFLVPGGADGLDPRVRAQHHSTVYGVQPWGDRSGTITGTGRPANGAFSVADPRLGRTAHNNILRLAAFSDASPCVTSGTTNVADPRLPTSAARHPAKLSVRTFESTAGTITGAGGGDQTTNVADPRLTCAPNGGTLRVVPMSERCPTVTATAGVWSTGSVQLADPRPVQPMRNGALGVQPFEGPSFTVTGSWDVHAGPAAVADPREAIVPIISPWGCWHRPPTVRELADLQAFPRVDRDGRLLVIAGGVTDQRMQIGNAVPPAAAQAVAEQMLRTLLSNDLGIVDVQGGGVWVRDAGVLHWYRTSRHQREIYSAPSKMQP